MSVFVTGGTGFLGRYLIQGLLESGSYVVALVRGRDREDAHRRQRGALAWLDEATAKRSDRAMTVCPGALDAPGLGLTHEDRELVLSCCDDFLHCGASIRFDLPLERARRVNVEGTRELLALARERQDRAGLARLDHVSTAFVAGRRAGLVRETETEARDGHRNSYERSKWEAEALVRDAARELPVTIFRPSIVVGEVAQGRTPSFTGFYVPVTAYASGLWRTAPARPDCVLDFVPVDFVRDAVLAIRRRPESRGRCVHLAAGEKGDVTLEEVVAVLQSFFSDREPVRFVDPDRWMRWVQPVIERIALGRVRPIVRSLRYFVPYLTANPRFDTRETIALLAGSGIEVPDLRAYVRRLLRFGVASDWGRRPGM